VTPQNPSVENTNQAPNRRFSNPTKVYKRRSPHNSLVVKSLFGQRLPLSPMALQPWITNAFKPLGMSEIHGCPHAMHDKFDKWLPKFHGNNFISAKEHIDTFYACFQNHPLNNDDEDVVTKLLVASLVENARK
jgi:hypothetical protein